LEEKYPDTTSPYAQEGSDAHRLLEKSLLSSKNPETFLGQECLREDGSFFLISKEMVDNISLCYHWLMERKGQLAYSQLHAESRVSAEWVHPDLAGTADGIIRQPFGTLVVYDLKYGMGVKVDSFQNPQLMIYALAALGKPTDFRMYDTVEIVIHQPRISPEPSIWVTTPNELYDWADEILKPGIKACLGKNPKLVPGEAQCRFCKAKINKNPKTGAEEQCPALKAKALQEAGDIFTSEPTLMPAELMKPEDFSRVLTLMPVFDLWRKSVEERAYVLLAEGQQIPGFKLVEGRSQRKWKDEAETEAQIKPLLGNGVYAEQKILSPAQMEKALKEAKALALVHLDALIDKPAGKPTVVPESDKRPALSMADPTQIFSLEE